MVERHVILLGKVGHGKSSVANKLCGESFESNMSAGSCTRGINIGTSLTHKFGVIDTPGFFASDNAAEHAAVQKEAMELTELSAILLIVKIGRADEMAQTLNQLMDFCGDDDDVCVIVTFADTVKDNSESAALDINAIRKRLSQLLEIDMSQITFIGKETPRLEIEDFIHKNMFPPRLFPVSDVQVASLASQSVGAVRYDNDIRSIQELIKAAKLFCDQTAALLPKNEDSFVEVRNALVRSTREETLRLANQQIKEVCARAEQELSTLEQEQELKSRVSREVSKRLEAFEAEYSETKSPSFGNYCVKGKHKGYHQPPATSRKRVKHSPTKSFATKYDKESIIELTEIPKTYRRVTTTLEKDLAVPACVAWKVQIWMNGKRATLECVKKQILGAESDGTGGKLTTGAVAAGTTAETRAVNANATLTAPDGNSNHQDTAVLGHGHLTFIEKFICPCFRWWQKAEKME
mmetsp:Transcript_24787/g.68591  ORF Transcript_24787/g.68591 Transcript_24787/m.68591 type:complete len:465 (-) Transcript_24787:129-1523(-)|eukprot:CAMPEP_0168725356 /NCGR_PEP_ID=MMETSP0724-20121128/4110_1 /TAXON_ID=265536 /ORGANISM="Amphiprora sp., Strain CCMP467" /LENGTH=464 /DNA_ID=CAMNT_0008772135 /DNA_START=2477 /DNA_END=3871 /DNA_ORIENTATION=-